jgi:HEAT repeat protein
VDKARQSVFESERLSADKAASLTVRLRKGALDLYTELALVKSWEVAAPSLGDFRKYLSESEGQQLLREGNFACYCPLCRGEAGVHYIRVFDLACNLYAAVYTVRQATEHNRDLLHQSVADYFYEAVQLLRPGAGKLISISWTATDPLRDLLRRYTAQHPDPALNLIDELLYYFQHGRWREPQRKVAATFPLAFQNGGAIAKLVLERTDALVSGFYPHPELLLATRWDEAFAEQFACAWERHAPDKTAALRWELEPYRSEGRVWDGVPISGPSVGAAVGVALKCLHALDLPPPDIDCALTGKLEPDGTLGSVGGYHQKTLPFDRYRALCLIVPSGDYTLAQSRLPDWGSRLRPAVDIDHALQQATHLPAAVQQYLQRLIEQLDTTPWYCNGQKLTNQQLFTPLRVLVQKPPQRDLDADEDGETTQDAPKRGGSEAPREKPANLYAELQAALYELTREYAQKEEIRWEEFVRRVQHEKRAALIGAPGSGKTFGTRHLVLTLAQQAVQQLQNGAALDAIQIPLWLPASLLAEKGNLASAIAEYLPNAPTEWLQHTLKQGRFLLVIDALDELPETQQNRFRDCAQQLDNTTGIVLVTCRTMHWEERSQWLGWKKLPDAAELAPLNLREQRAIAERFFSENPRGAQAMQQRLRESYVLRHACRTPLLLTFACLLQSENQLRSGLTYAQLYARILRYLIQGKWRNVAEPLAASDMGEERVLRQLETLVWNLFLQSPERNLFTLDAWVSAGSNAPSAPLAPAELLENLERVGVVVSAGYDDVREDRQWSFAHRSILEFLAARHLSRQENWREEISQHFWFQPEWVEVLTFLVGLVENADPLVERLEQEQDDIFGSMLLLQARVVGFGRVSETVAQRVTTRAVERYLSREIPEKFTLPPLQALGRHVVPLLVQALQDEAWSVRKAACEALGAIGDPQAIPHLAQALQDEAWWVRKAPCWALGAIGDPQAIPPLLQALQYEDRWVRKAACKALGAIGDPQAIPPLLQALKDEDRWVREAAYWALGAIGDPQAIPPLLQALKDEDRWVREAAYWALGAIGDPQAIPHLAQALQDEDRWVRKAACEALGKIGDPQAIPPLLQALKDEDRWVRAAAYWALGAIGDPQAIPPLLQALQDEDRWVREAAYWALGKIGDPQAIPHLAQALQDEAWWVRKAACEALGAIGDPQAIPHLVQALQDEDRLVRKAACEALGAIGDPQAIPHLAQALQDEDRLVRKAACEALGAIGDPQAIPHLAQALQDEDRLVRKAACEALGAIGDPQAIPPLLQALQDEDWGVHKAAWEALGKIGDPQAIPPLLQALKDEDWWVCEAACEALGKIGDPQAIPPLLQALKDEDSYVRVAACEALWRISRRHKIPIRQSPSHFRGLWRTLFGWIKRVFRLAFRR